MRVLPAPTSATAPQPAIVAPSTVKLTVPVGATPATLAVNVTDAPTTDGLAELAMPVVDTALFTVCASVDDVDPLWLVSPAYVATMLRLPTGSAAVEHWAVRMLPAPVRATAVQPPTATPLSVNATVPVGVVPVTVAVNVTDVPTVDGFAELASPVVEFALLTVCDSGELVDPALPALPP